MGEITFSSLNCRGLRDRKKRKDVLDFLQNKSSNIYCLVDTHRDLSLENIVKTEFNLDCFFAAGTSNSRDVAVIFNNNFDYIVNNVKYSDAVA